MGINVDGNSATHRGLRLLGDEDDRWQNVGVRARRYLNHVVEQDHRAIKQRCAPMLGLKTFRSAAIALAGIELAHRIRKQQYFLPMGVSGRASSPKDAWAAALVDSSVPTSGCEDRFSPMHQNSAHRLHPAREPARIEGSVRHPRKISFGGNLYLLVRPQAGRYWHYHYRYGGKRKTLSLGWEPIRTHRLPGRSCAIARRGVCSPWASTRHCGGANCGVSRARSLRRPPGFPRNGFKPGDWFAVGSK